MTPNPAIDSDTYSAPLRALSSARHCERWAPRERTYAFDPLLPSGVGGSGPSRTSRRGQQGPLADEPNRRPQ